jgi:signal transduction histidine kinase
MNDVNIFAIFALVNGIVSVTFGVLVVSKNWRDRMNQVFFLMTIALAVWAFSYWRWQLATEYSTALLWVRLLSVGSLYIPVLFYHWVIILIEARSLINRIVLWVTYAATFAIFSVANTELFIAGLERKGMFPFWPSPGMAYDIYFSYIYVGLVLYALYLLLRAHAVTDDRDKRGQILYVILGCLFGFGGGLTNFPLWWGINIPPYGNALVAAFPFLLGYSVIRYKLFNLRMIIAELLVFSLLVFMCVIVLIADTWTLRAVYGVFLLCMSAVGVILIKSSYAIEEANAGKTNLIHVMNHQIKGRLGAGKNIFAELLTGDYGAIPEPAQALLKRGLEEMATGVSYIQTILQGMSAENGTLPYDMRPISFKDIVMDVAAKGKEEAERKGLSFTLQLADSDYSMLGDAAQLKEAVRNLIDNAISYTPHGSVSIALARRGNTIRFSVADTGIGIRKEDQAKLFKAGGRGRDSARINVNSTGYGLAFVKGVVEAHQGRIWFESDGVSGRGATFFVELPVGKYST